VVVEVATVYVEPPMTVWEPLVARASAEGDPETEIYVTTPEGPQLVEVLTEGGATVNVEDPITVVMPEFVKISGGPPEADITVTVPATPVLVVVPIEADDGTTV